LALGGAAVLFGAFGLLNVVRGRRFLSIPTRVGVPELTAFVVLPALLPALFSRQFLFAFDTILANLAIIGLAYIVVGFGLVPIGRDAVLRAAASLGIRAGEGGAAAAVLLPRDVLHDGDLAVVHGDGSGEVLDGDLPVRADRLDLPDGAPAERRARGPGRSAHR